MFNFVTSYLTFKGFIPTTRTYILLLVGNALFANNPPLVNDLPMLRDFNEIA